MSDKRVSALDELTLPANDDEILIVDKDDTTQSPQGSTKRIKKSNLNPDISWGDIGGTIVNQSDLQSALDDKADDTGVVHNTTAEEIGGQKTFLADPIVPDEAYGAGWDGSTEVPTKNALYDKIETLGGGGGGGFQKGFLSGGKIKAEITGGDLTISIVTLDGSTPSAESPVLTMIGSEEITITGEVSFTAAAGTNWLNAGAHELGYFSDTFLDFFVYLIQEKTTGLSPTVKIGFSRRGDIPSFEGFIETIGNDENYIQPAIFSDYHIDFTGDQELVWDSGISDSYNVENIGRFTAHLSGTPNFIWDARLNSEESVSMFNIISRPITETRLLPFSPTYTGFGVAFNYEYFFQLVGSRVSIFPGSGTFNLKTSNSTGMTMTLPFTCGKNFDSIQVQGRAMDNDTILTNFGAKFSSGSNILTYYKVVDTTGWTASGHKYAVAKTDYFLPMADIDYYVTSP